MVFRAYGIIDDTDNDVLVMGAKPDGFLADFVVFFGGRVEQNEPTKDAFLRELAEESNKRVTCNPDEVHRFESFDVTTPTTATLFFFRGIRPTYTGGAIPHPGEIGAVVSVSATKLLTRLPENPNDVTARQVADAMMFFYGNGDDLDGYRTSGIMRALRDYLVEYYYD